MSDDRNIDDLLCDYLEGELDAARTREVEELLAHDPEKRKLVEEMRADRSTLKGLALESLPKASAEAIHQAIVAPAPIRLSATIRLAQVAAVVAITVGGSLLIWTALPHTASQAPIALHTAQAPMADGEAPAGTVVSEARLEETLARKAAPVPAPAAPATVAPSAADAAGKAGPEPFAMKSQGKASANDMAKSKDDGMAGGGFAQSKQTETGGLAGGMPPGMAPNMPAASSAAAQPGGGFGPPALGLKTGEQDALAESARAGGNAQVVMIVTASDVSTVQHEVDQLLATNRIATDRQPMPMGEAFSNSWQSPTQQAMPSVDRKDEALAVKELSGKQAAQTQGGGMGGAGGRLQAPMAPAEQNAAGKPMVVARNLSPAQLQTVRQDMLRLNRGRGVTIRETAPPAARMAASQPSRQQVEDARRASLQQMQRQMPSAAPRDLDRAFTQARQQAQGYRDEQQQPLQQQQFVVPQMAAGPQNANVDLLIIFQQLLPGAGKDTLPATTPR
jgi:anti-sigma factor RsiW